MIDAARTVALVSLILTSSCGAKATPQLPHVMVWAWERAEDLGFLEPERDSVGVAALVATLELGDREVRVHRRRGSLRYPPAAAVLPVVRIEPLRDASPSLDEAQRATILRALLDELQRGGAARLQVDFEALRSQRSGYVALLHELRAAVGSRVSISVTALASWCLADRWMGSLPVDEIVPMFYRLGKDAPELRAALAAGHDLAPECRAAIGMITDEPDVYLPSDRRTYLFSPVPWRQEAFAQRLVALRRGAPPR